MGDFGSPGHFLENRSADALLGFPPLITPEFALLRRPLFRGVTGVTKPIRRHDTEHLRPYASV